MMNIKIPSISRKTKLIILISVLVVLVLFYLILVFYNIHSLARYDEEFLPNTYIGDFDMTYYSFDKAKIKIDFYEDFILKRNVNLVINGNKYEYSLGSLGVSVDVKRIVSDIKEYQKGLSYSEKIRIINHNIKKVFPYYYKVDSDKLVASLNEIKKGVDVATVEGYFDTSNGVVYNKGVPGYSFDVEKNSKIIMDKLSGNVDLSKEITLDGEVLQVQGEESFQSIDTMTSSFVTDFMPNTYLRNINLNTALGYINGTVVNAGEVFSYCDIAGPFNKQGYVFYYEFVGNGVCQIATTTYNAALLGGLEIVKRYPHAKKSLYVAGGLDATVASYGGGWCADMQFKNTYEYPIYIKAYSEGGRAHVEFWSNSQAKKGLEYTTSSVQIGARGYRSYLHTWKEGQEIDVHEIATTWYTED